jgi:hypothetical protein
MACGRPLRTMPQLNVRSGMTRYEAGNAEIRRG